MIMLVNNPHNPQLIPDLYRDPPSDEDRLIRMHSELSHGFKEMHPVQRALSFFGSAKTPVDHPEYQNSLDLAKYLGEEGWTIITGGGPGIMEAANKGAQA